MEDLKSKAGNLTDSITDFLETKYKLTLLNAADKATTVSASLLASVVVLFLGTFVLLFASIALGVWLGQLLDSAALGYLLVAVLYTTIILIVVAMRKRIVFPMIRNKLINKLYEPNHQNVQRSVRGTGKFTDSTRSAETADEGRLGSVETRTEPV